MAEFLMCLAVGAVGSVAATVVMVLLLVWQQDRVSKQPWRGK
jgi:uncharacterized membrane protein